MIFADLKCGVYVYAGNAGQNKYPMFIPNLFMETSAA